MFINLSSLSWIRYIVGQRGKGTFFTKIKILGPWRKLRENFTEKGNIWSESQTEMALEKEGEIKKQFYKKENMWSESGKDQKEANEQKGDN